MRARQIVAPYLAAGRWDITPPNGPDGPGGGDLIERALDQANAPATGLAFIREKQKKGLFIADGVRTCLEQQASQAAPNTLKKYRDVLHQFERYSAEIGLRYLEEWTPGLVRDFRASWGNKPITAQKKLGYLKAFFEVFVEDGILSSNPARIKTRLNRALRARESAVQKLPFTNEELERMLAACQSLGRTELRRWPKKRDGRQVIAMTEYRDYHRKWTGEDLADFILLSVYTGLFRDDTLHVAVADHAEQVRAARVARQQLPKEASAQERGSPRRSLRHSHSTSNAQPPTILYDLLWRAGEGRGTPPGDHAANL